MLFSAVLVLVPLLSIDIQYVPALSIQDVTEELLVITAVWALGEFGEMLLPCPHTYNLSPPSPSVNSGCCRGAAGHRSSVGAGRI